MDADVVIVGAGPAGLMLAGDLAEAGVQVIVLEQTDRPATHPRAWGLQPRTQETLALRGLLEDIADGVGQMEGTMFGSIGLDYSQLETPFPCFLHAPQTRTEGVLRARALRAGAEIRFGVTVTGLEQSEDVVAAHTTQGDFQAAYLAGCDGGRSRVREAAGLRLVGWDATSTALFADVELADPAQAFAVRGARSEAGMVMLLRRPPSMFRVIVLEFQPLRPGEKSEVSAEDLHAALVRVAGRDVDFTSVAWASRFTDAARVADKYRTGRIVLAGDAAHVHSPFGGQGLNLGVQDAAGLGWRLARAVLHDEDTLDWYEAERRPVAERVVANTRTQSRLLAADPDDALAAAYVELATAPAGNRRLAGQVSGLDIAYPSDDQDPRVGRFLPARLLADGGIDQIARTLRYDDFTPVTDGGDTLLARPDGYVAGTRG